MSLKLNQSLLEENIKLRKEKSEQSQQLQLLNQQISKLTNQIDQLLARPVNTVVVNNSADVKPITAASDIPIFIPSPAPNELSSNISDLKVKTRDTNIFDSVDKLSKLNEPKK